MDFLQLSGKRFLIFGVANKKSVAYAVSKMLLEEGAECVFVVQNQAVLE
ncbi:MAG: enoyl-ACP reductase, partial [Thermoguttaceae bacterium]|nr:enoyl-ACP reductase [Thermoguttaceae bacterium]